MFRVVRKIRVGRETGNTHIYFFGLMSVNPVFVHTHRPSKQIEIADCPSHYDDTEQFFGE